MKLCIPVATPDGLNAALEADFGAAQHLLILDSDSEVIHTVDRAKPELISEDVVAGIQGILCGEIHPRLLFELQQNGIQVFGCEADSAATALAQFRAGELEAAPTFSLPPEVTGHEHGGCCGGKGHDDDAHECCGGKGHDDDDAHECCGGKAHAEGKEHECCGGKGHDEAARDECSGGHHNKKAGGGCGCGH